MQKKYWKNLKIFKTTNPEPSFLKTFSLAANSYLISLEKLKRLTVTQNISILLFIKSKLTFKEKRKLKEEKKKKR